MNPKARAAKPVVDGSGVVATKKFGPKYPCVAPLTGLDGNVMPVAVGYRRLENSGRIVIVLYVDKDVVLAPGP